MQKKHIYEFYKLLIVLVTESTVQNSLMPSALNHLELHVEADLFLDLNACNTFALKHTTSLFEIQLGLIIYFCSGRLSKVDVDEFSQESDVTNTANIVNAQTLH